MQMSKGGGAVVKLGVKLEKEGIFENPFRCEVKLAFSEESIKMCF